MIEILTIFAAEEAESSGGISALGFDPKAFIIQLITFLLVFYILKRYVFDIIVNMLEKRRKTIEEGLSLTAKLTEEKSKLDKEVAEMRSTARKEADEILAASHEQATQMLKEAEEAAGKRADIVLEEARKKIAEETKQARRELEKDVVELVIKATEAVSGERLDPKKDSNLIANSLKAQG